MSEKLEFELAVKNNQLDPALDKASKKSGDLQDVLNTALGVFGGGAALKGFDLLGDAIDSVIDYGVDAVAAAAAQEDAYNKLGQSLRAAGDSSKDSLESMISFAEGMESISKQSAEAVAAQLAYSKSLGLTNTQSKQLVQAAAELSATFGGSLEQNVSLLGKTFDGTAGRLGKLIPALQELTSEQLATGEAAKLINEKFGGNAAAELDSYTGRLHVMASAFDSLKKQIGGMIVGSSDLGEGQGVLTEIVTALTQAISDWRVESARANGTITETDASIDQLKRKYQELAVEFIDLEQKSLNPTMWQYVTGQAAYAAEELENYRKAMEDAKKEYESANAAKNSGGSQSAETPGTRQLPDDILNSRAKLNEEILLLDQQLVAEQNNLGLEQQNIQIQNETERQLAEIQRITDFAATKAELEFQNKEQEIIRLQEGEDQKLALQKLYGEKELALTKIRNDGIIKAGTVQRDAEKKASAERIALQQATASTITGIVGTAANLATLFTKDGSKEQFYIQKSAALAQAIVATNLAMAMANTVPPPENIPAIAAAKANGAIAISGIVAATIKGFADGGIVGGESGASPGRDNVTINARKGEMFLNAEQQAKLFDWISSGSVVGGNGDMTIVCDGDVLFRIIRNKVKQGYKLS